jgi:hypothetical protein
VAVGYITCILPNQRKAVDVRHLSPWAKIWRRRKGRRGKRTALEFQVDEKSQCLSLEKMDESRLSWVLLCGHSRSRHLALGMDPDP